MNSTRKRHVRATPEDKERKRQAAILELRKLATKRKQAAREKKS